MINTIDTTIALQNLDEQWSEIINKNKNFNESIERRAQKLVLRMSYEGKDCYELAKLVILREEQLRNLIATNHPGQ